MVLVQLDFLEETEISIIKARMVELEAKLERQRKGQFAKIGEQRKEIDQLKETVDLLVRNLCQKKPEA